MRMNIIYTYFCSILAIDTMKARLNLTIDQSLLEDVKQYATLKNTSVSELVEEYFKVIIQPKKKSFVELIKELPKPKIDENFDWKEEYYKDKMKKYGL
ncbi:MAG: hypothetical protein RL387_1395 [Bacteroidota bacterium]